MINNATSISMNGGGINKDKLKDEITQANNSSTRANMNDSFILPAQGNSITRNDISRSQLRITVDFKRYFPLSNCTLTVSIGQQTYAVKFRARDSRSHVLQLGKPALNQIGLRSGESIRVRRIGHSAYTISRVT